MKIRPVLAILALLTLHGPALAAPADEIQTLLEKGNAAAAYALAKKHPDQLGRPSFDFYFGVAAIDSGHAGEGVLALERYVVNFPNNLEARLELARGYFVLGENQRAREEFSGVLKANPPPPVVANVERYLDAIRSRESAYRTTAGMFIEVGFGYDSNINSGVSNSVINLPTFGQVTIGQSGTKIDRKFMQATAGANVSVPLAPGISAFGSLSGDLKTHDGNREFDQTNTSTLGGLSIIDEKNLYRVSLGYANLGVDYRNFRDAASITGEWIRQWDELQAVSASLQYAKLKYAGSNDIRDADLKGLGFGYRLALVAPWRPAFTVNANYSIEDNGRGRDDLGRDIYALRTGIALSPAPKWGVSAGIGYQQSVYAARDPLLLNTRRDKYLGLDAGASYALNRNLSIRGELTAAKNQSNLELYKFRRDLMAVKIRYETK